MTNKLFMMAAIVATSGLFLATSEVQAQGGRIDNRTGQNRGINTRVYSPTINRSYVYPSGFRSYRTYTPNYSYSPNYRSYSSYGYPNSLSYGNGYRVSQVYQYPNRYNYGNYGSYRQSYSNGFRIGNTGFTYYQR